MFYALAMPPYGFWGMLRRYQSSLHWDNGGRRLLRDGANRKEGRAPHVPSSTIESAAEMFNVIESSLHIRILQTPAKDAGKFAIISRFQPCKRKVPPPYPRT